MIASSDEKLKEKAALEALERVLRFTKEQIRAYECRCGVGPGGLSMCKRCLLLDPRYS